MLNFRAITKISRKHKMIQHENRNISFECQKKNTEMENFKPRKLLRSSLSLEIRSTPLPQQLKLKKVLKSISYCELKQ